MLAQDYFGLAPFVAVAALGAFIGHLFPVWLGFRGGKGVSTFIGIAFALDWEVALFTSASWLVVARATRYSSLAALVSTGLTPDLFRDLRRHAVGRADGLLAVMIFVAHRANIVRA